MKLILPILINITKGKMNREISSSFFKSNYQVSMSAKYFCNFPSVIFEILIINLYQ